jgi:thiol-disulfide isomerase/thioredoxin
MLLRALIFSLATLINTSGLIYAQLATTKSGIHFLPGSFASATAVAKAAHKPLFVEVYLTGCPHCEALAPILAEKPVGDFFNANFISWKVEANAPESVALQKNKDITYPEFPLFLFFDSDGNLLHVGTPAEQTTKTAFIDEVISAGRTALNPAQRTSNYPSRFEAGDRELAFLINYGKYCKVRKDNQRLHEISDALGKTLQLPDQIKSPVGFYCLQRLIDDIDNPTAVYFFSHLSEFTATHPVKDVKEAGEGVIFRSLYGARGDQYPAQKIVQMRAYMVGLGVPANEAASRTLLKELDAHLRTNSTQGAVQRFNEYRRENTAIGVADYAYLMHYFNEKATDKTYLPEMPLWASDGLKTVKPDQQNTKQTADIHYELAIAYQKMEQKAEALKQAQQGLDIASKATIETKRYEEQVTSLK